VNFDFLEDILNKSLIDNLMINPKDTPLIFTECSVHNKESRLKLTEFMFEKYHVPAIFICKSPVLASFSCGRSTAVILDSGLKGTYATPVHDGYALQKCIIKSDIGGSSVTSDLMNWVEKEKGIEVMPRFTFKKKF
jgi:actin-like protein 6A